MRETIDFNVNIIGSSSKKLWTGVFTVKTSLSYREIFREDEVRRSLLGADPGNANPYVDRIARYAAQLSVGIVKGPAWYDQSVYCTEGLPGKDLNVLTEVVEEMAKALKAETDSVSSTAEAAQAELKEAAKPA